MDKLINEISEKLYGLYGTGSKGFDLGEARSGVELAKRIDHTILKPDATTEDIKKLCEEALKYNFASVCVNPCNVKLASDLLKESGVDVCTVIGFPLGASTTESKIAEAGEAVKNGAVELDMVINIGALKSGNLDFVKNDIEKVVYSAGNKAIVKVIIETCLLTTEEKITACILAKLAGAAFVKTSTGFSTGGAKVEDIRLMRKVVGDKMGVKASGGIRDYETAISMIEAGADRLGTSASVSIVQGCQI